MGGRRWGHLLGHSSITTTQVYARSIDSRTKTSLLKLDYEAKAAPVRRIREWMHTRCTPKPGKGAG